MKVVLCFDDVVVTATRNPDLSRWSIWIVESFRGKTYEGFWSDLEFASVAFLMLENDSTTSELRGQIVSGASLQDTIDTCYAIAEPLMAKMPGSCRCIP